MTSANRKSHKIRALSDLIEIRNREGSNSPRAFQLEENARYFGAKEREIDRPESTLRADVGAIPEAEIFDDDTTRIVVHAQAAMQPSEYKNGGAK